MVLLFFECLSMHINVMTKTFAISLLLPTARYTLMVKKRFGGETLITQKCVMDTTGDVVEQEGGDKF